VSAPAALKAAHRQVRQTTLSAALEAADRGAS
jgi:hypothetical protein